MIDWVTFVFRYDKPIRIKGGVVSEFDENDNVRWSICKYKQVKGSYDNTSCVKTLEMGPDWADIEVSGNPAKFFQGHNLYGSDDLRAIVKAYAIEIMSRLGYSVSEKVVSDLDFGNVDLRRVDCTRMYSLLSRETVREWIRAAGVVISSSHQTVKKYEGQTLYIGKNSRRITTKIYCKGDEFVKPVGRKDGGRVSKNAGRTKDTLVGNIPEGGFVELVDYADDKLRVEVVIRSMELKKRGLRRLSNWFYTDANDNTSQTIISERIKDMKLPEKRKLEDDVLLTLPYKVQATYVMWRDGRDLRAMLPKKTFYRYRSALMNHGLDISVACPEKTYHVVPLMRVLEAKPCMEIPAFASEYGLYFEPLAYKIAA